MKLGCKVLFEIIDIIFSFIRKNYKYFVLILNIFFANVTNSYVNQMVLLKRQTTKKENIFINQLIKIFFSVSLQRVFLFGRHGSEKNKNNRGPAHFTFIFFGNRCGSSYLISSCKMHTLLLLPFIWRCSGVLYPYTYKRPFICI